MSIAGGLQGEFQVTNGYGPFRAPQIMKKDLEFKRTNELVRLLLDIFNYFGFTCMFFTKVSIKMREEEILILKFVFLMYYCVYNREDELLLMESSQVDKMLVFKPQLGNV